MVEDATGYKEKPMAPRNRHKRGHGDKREWQQRHPVGLAQNAKKQRSTTSDQRKRQQCGPARANTANECGRQHLGLRAGAAAARILVELNRRLGRTERGTQETTSAGSAAST